MKRVKQNYDVEISEIRQFLVDAGWSVRNQSSKLTFYSPPPSLRIKGEYSIALPNAEAGLGVDAFMVQAIDALEDLYGFRFQKLKEKLASKPEADGPAQFNVRFVDKMTSDGGMPLPSIKTFIEQMQKGLYEAVKFKLDGSSHGPSNLVAANFTNECRFLQTQKGSFVARIEVPFGWLSQGDLFQPVPVSTHEVCSAVHSAIQFITDKILKSDEPFDSDIAISEAVTLFDPELLETLSKMLVSTDMDCIEVAMEIGSQRRFSATGIINDDRRNRLFNYVDFIKRHFYGDDAIDVAGLIIELRSRDPASDANHVRVVADYFGDKTYVSATLSNEQYAIAVEAHRNKWNVRVRGSGIRLKTQIKITKVDGFELV